MYKYRGFGLHILSEIEFPELFPDDTDITDVTIRIDDIPSFIIDRATQGYIINENELFFTVKDIGVYYAAFGNKIIISPAARNKDMRDIRTFALGTAMSAILLQRKLLPLHTSAILQDDELILISGHSGAGKSTTTASLGKIGFTIFSDDITVLENNNNCITGTASYPMIRLWEDALQTLDHSSFQDRSFPVKSGVDKYGIFFHDDFISDQYPVKKILLLEVGNQLKSEKLSGTKAFELISNQVFRQNLLQGPVLRSLSFSIISRLLQQAAVYHITRPANCDPEELLLLVLPLCKEKI
jgi:ABC-type uncharacterized transport system YnjBCD ATPase subunit